MLKIILNIFVFINRVLYVYDKTKSSDCYYIKSSWEASTIYVQENLVKAVNTHFNCLSIVKEIHHYQNNLHRIGCRISDREIQRFFQQGNAEVLSKQYLLQKIIQVLTNNIYEFVTFYGNKETGEYIAEILIAPKRK